ncbi:putative sterigmatocystin biosynthesis P450 monooxygenase STCB [Madurella mycetomatis]|uniref:Sterigmatocystin biosynthesis P450 monooxygenase STCB n=1 Tax=Madurella mycetomatis TaxID=100816 RepID=A0A175WCN5_9PEZI|nr:putative sterigmatocystin biosynthesis P450 monooxygenase STCB [Madurella mycetomatis]
MLRLGVNSSYTADLVLLVLVLFAISHVYRTLKRPISQVPGPWVSKWTDIVVTYYWLTGRRAKYVHGLHQKYGPVVRVSPYEVDFSDIAVTKEVYSVKEVYLKSSFYTKVIPRSTISIFNVNDVNLHRRYRRLLSNNMSESSLKSMYPVIEAKVSLAIQNMRDEMQKRGATDVFKWWLFMATDIIGELTFGESFCMLEQKKKNQYIVDLESADAIGALRSTFPTLSYISGFLPLPIFRRAADATRGIIRYGEESLARHARLELVDPANSKTTLFRKMYKAEEDEQLSFKEILDNAMTYIIAGSDTTSNTLTYLTWAVCRHPSVKAALLKELATLPIDGFGDQELKELPYLNAVIEETLRLYGAAPSSLPRDVPPGGAYLAGYWLGEGTTVSSQAYTLHRDPETFPQPEIFDPSRWETPTKAMKDAMFAFGGGARICIGIHLARMELRLAVARFFRAFPDAKISKLEGMSDGDMEQKIYFLSSPTGKRCLVEAH